MRVTRVTHSMRTLGVAALVVTVPLPLAACAQSEATESVLATELRAATGADVFSEPSVQTYSVDDISLSKPGPEVLRSLGLPPVTSSGSLELSDGVITEAELTVTTGVAHQSISFELSEPLVLRRDDHSAEPVDATGVLEIGGVQHHNAQLTLTPEFANDGTATLDIEFDVPEGVLSPLQHSGVPLPGLGDTIAATVSLRSVDSPALTE